ncbi:hypothetical protein [Thiothrix fructosivorans]|uniref:Uncharacterized protein n=1 Tax=Thiothrix fructosivorans TaxID=111770 RepID=A0A8B0SJ85_9GAMM|nr:hypothetical protein [Thiothrix fructosivorans]MBO0613697.1 hypothetical protein [Thiothrix fructosivorans]QTX10889.1 hypothetical protein J1836_000475 [Thiothrix fructosivorans]
MTTDINKPDDTELLLQNMQRKLTESSYRDNKGRAAIAKLLTSDNAIRLIESTADKLGIEPITVGRGLALAMCQYRTGSQINVTDLGNAINPDGVGVRFGRETIIPLAIELGFIVKTGERSTAWAAYDKIGHKPGLLDGIKSAFTATPEKLAAKAESERAYAEKCKLDTARKAEAFAQRRKEALMRTVNAAQEAEKLATSLPGQPETIGDKIKANPAAAVLIGFLAVGIGAAVMTSEPQQQALAPLIANVNGSPTLDPRILEGE